MGIEHLEVLIDKEDVMTKSPSDDDRKDSSPSPPMPVDNPDLPEDGDPDEVEEQLVPDDQFDDPEDDNTMDDGEEPDAPNDLSGVDKEFEDNN